MKRNNYDLYFNDVNKQIFTDEPFNFLQNFKYNLKSDIEKINANFEHLQNILDEIKESQINFLLEMDEKILLEDKNTDLNNHISSLFKDIKYTKIDSINESENSNEKIDMKRDHLYIKYSTIKKYFDFYISSFRNFSTLNKNLTHSIEEKYKEVITNYKSSILDEKIAELNKSNDFKKENCQVIMRMKNDNSVIYCNLKDKQLKTRTFVNKSNNFKNSYRNDQIELNLDNKLFFVAGEKYDQFFSYNYERNEITQLDDLKHSHFFGNLIYVHHNNCFYCIGGNDSKKCEIYRNDKIINPLFAQDVKINENSWTTIADLKNHRQEFTTLLFNVYIYAFFGFNNSTNINNNTIERLNVLKNDKWEIISYSNPSNLNLKLNSHSSLILNDKEIIILGGYDGLNYSDKTFIYNIQMSRFTANQMTIPELKKNNFYYFSKESSFIKISNFKNGTDEVLFNYAIFDSRDKLHLVNSRNYHYEVLENKLYI